MPAMMKIKSCFFDRPAVIRAVGAARAAAMRRSGSLVRTIARNSIRPSKRRVPVPHGAPWSRPGGTMWASSVPGKPPLGHCKLLKMIYFAWDASSKTEVIGPMGFGKAEAPNLEEFGGKAARRPDLRKGHAGQTYTANYPKRSFMRPALEKAAPYLANAWASSVHS